jgi:hypothetical protein
MSDPLITYTPNDDGIIFTVTVGSTDRKCVITEDALQALCPPEDEPAKMTEIFWAYEDRIHWVARRLINAGEWGNPLVLEPRYFS